MHVRLQREQAHDRFLPVDIAGRQKSIMALVAGRVDFDPWPRYGGGQVIVIVIIKFL